MLYVLYGISGGGKTTLGRELQSLGLIELVSHTTRPMRKGEIDGFDYHFVTESAFDEIELIEFSYVPMKDAVYRYGLSKKEVSEKLNEGKDVFVTLNQEGYTNVKKMFGDLVKGIFITISKEEAFHRMIVRGDSKEAAESRILKNDEIVQDTPLCDSDIVITNDVLAKSIEAIKGIVL